MARLALPHPTSRVRLTLLSLGLGRLRSSPSCLPHRGGSRSGMMPPRKIHGESAHKNQDRPEVDSIELIAQITSQYLQKRSVLVANDKTPWLGRVVQYCQLVGFDGIMEASFDSVPIKCDLIDIARSKTPIGRLAPLLELDRGDRWRAIAAEMDSVADGRQRSPRDKHQQEQSTATSQPLSRSCRLSVQQRSRFVPEKQAENDGEDCNDEGRFHDCLSGVGQFGGSPD